MADNENTKPDAANMADEKKTEPVAQKDVQQLLQQLALAQQQPPKQEGKAPEEYKFWKTQPVPQFKEPNLLQTSDGTEADGPILPEKVCRAAAKAQPEALIDGFVWDDLDLENKAEVTELYDLLFNHYVEDTDGSFRFNYSVPFLNWALKPPGWRRDWHIAVRTKPSGDKKGKLVAFISAVPVTLNVRGARLKVVEINFLSIHRKLRSKRLAPVLIKEATRRCYHIGIFQALYTAGTLLPTPVSTCRYYHRSLDWKHLFEHGFSGMPRGSSEREQVRRYYLTSTTKTKGLRLMKPADVPAVQKLLEKYLNRFEMRQEFDEKELTHSLCSDAAKGVVWSYVVEQGGKITDFISYYLLESTVLKATSRSTIRAAYLYYYASEAAFQDGKAVADDNAALSARLNELVHDALILAKQAGFHVFNALSLLDNPLFLKDQKFAGGDGKLHFYLFNWKAAPIASGLNDQLEADPTKMGGVGVVML